jgi:anthraniloyl-CoA monooxygenase
LVLCGDGVASLVRSKWADTFRPTVTQGKARFAWLGTTKPLKAFTFVFAPTDHGMFAVHAYPYRTSPTTLSTWIVECHEDTWRKAGLDRCDEAETRTRMEALFAPWLDGHPLLINRSIWRSFPTVTCERWSAGKFVLLGDASHTAHFSIGSGTKLADGGRHRVGGRLQDARHLRRAEDPRSVHRRASSRDVEAAEGREDEPRVV